MIFKAQEQFIEYKNLWIAHVSTEQRVTS